MAYTKSPRPYKHEYEKQVARGEHADRMERQRARRALDKKGVSRAGKDVSHVKEWNVLKDIRGLGPRGSSPSTIRKKPQSF